MTTATTSFVEDSFALSPNDIIQNRYNGRSDFRYWLEENISEDPSIASVCIGGNKLQELDLEWKEITFGRRAYFVCSCGHRACKLYLPPHGHEFKCRECHKLQYRLSSFNKNSVAGRAIYRMNRLQKLTDSRANMSRILYDGKFSKRFESFLRLCDRAGLDSIVNGVNDLKALIQQ